MPCRTFVCGSPGYHPEGRQGLEDEVEDEGPEDGSCCGKPIIGLHFPALKRKGVLGQSLKGAESEPD